VLPLYLGKFYGLYVGGHLLVWRICIGGDFGSYDIGGGGFIWAAGGLVMFGYK
jgi:hypothetical protein